MPVCPVCRRSSPEGLVFTTDIVVSSEIRSQHPAWKDSDGLCSACLAEYEKRVSA